MSARANGSLDFGAPFAGSLAREDRGDWEKVLAMVCLGGGSFIFGMLPVFLSRRNRFPLTTSLLLCFGSGILLATALVHILPEVREKITEAGFAEIYLCAGFFMIYFLDEFIHYFFGEAMQHTHSAPAPSAATTTNGLRSHYGATSTPATPLLQAEDDDDESHPEPRTSSHGHSHAARPAECHGAASVAAANARICHHDHNDSESCAQTNLTGTLGLSVALSLHSLIEGLAIGVQNTAAKVLFLLGAVSCHKFVMAFCLGLQLRSFGQARGARTQFIGITAFAVGAVLGIGGGMLIVDVPSVWMQSVLPIIQALAGGTLLYVTVCEVLPREKAKWHQSAARKAAGLLQFLSVAAGFAVMSLINFYLNDGD